jgi:hypothetical protein
MASKAAKVAPVESEAPAVMAGQELRAATAWPAAVPLALEAMAAKAVMQVSEAKEEKLVRGEWEGWEAQSLCQSHSTVRG